jgi:hypothetical protein
MTQQGIYDRQGERLGYLDGLRVYDLNDNWIGDRRGDTIYDREGDRHWRLHHDALLDLRGNVIGYLGTPTPHDR